MHSSKIVWTNTSIKFAERFFIKRPPARFLPDTRALGFDFRQADVEASDISEERCPKTTQALKNLKNLKNRNNGPRFVSFVRRDRVCLFLHMLKEGEEDSEPVHRNYPGKGYRPRQREWRVIPVWDFRDTSSKQSSGDNRHDGSVTEEQYSLLFQRL